MFESNTFAPLSNGAQINYVKKIHAKHHNPTNKDFEGFNKKAHTLRIRRIFD